METKRPKFVSPWMVTISVMLATFMEILDSTVVNVSIPHIAGNLGSTNEEGTWVVTSYLVSNAVILPMSGWLANRFGRRRMMMLCVTGFTITSFCCGLATSLGQLILFRVLQGATGGGMQPMAQAILLETFPREKHGQAMAAFGLGIILAPILGPALGGYITDNYTWRWIFYLNIPIGIASLFLMGRLLFDPPYIQRPKGGVDLWGMGFLALGFGTLQVVLDTGQRKDWYSSDFIRFFTALCIVGLMLFVIREVLVKHPIVDLRVLRDTTFSTGVFIMSMMGFILYGSLVLLPLYLQTLLGYPAYQAGLAMSPRGLGSLLMMPVVGYLTSKYDVRKLLVIGLIVGATTMFQLSRLSLNAGYWDIFWPQVFQGAALAFLMIPLMTASMARIPKEKMGNATSIYNLMRNIGGSFGIAIMTTFIMRRGQVNQNNLISHIASGDPETMQMLSGMKAWFIASGYDAYTAERQAVAGIYGLLQQHAAMLSFVQAFSIMGFMFAAMLPLVFLLRRAGTAPTAKEPRRKPQVESGAGVAKAKAAGAS